MASGNYLTRDDLKKFPVKYFEVVTVSSSSSESGETCDICLESYKINDLIKTIPCLHIFHSQCIDNWLLNSPTCPNCRLNVCASLKTLEILGNVPQSAKIKGKIISSEDRQKTNDTKTEKLREHHKFMNKFYLGKRHLRQYAKNKGIKRNRRSSSLDSEHRNLITQNGCNSTNRSFSVPRSNQVATTLPNATRVLNSHAHFRQVESATNYNNLKVTIITNEAVKPTSNERAVQWQFDGAFDEIDECKNIFLKSNEEDVCFICYGEIICFNWNRCIRHSLALISIGPDSRLKNCHDCYSAYRNREMIIIDEEN